MRQFAIVIAALTIGMGIGAVAGAFLLQRTLFSGAAAQDAADTIERVEILSRLRLGETDIAIEILEGPLPETVLFLSSTGDSADRTEDNGRYRALMAAKAYWDVVPTTGEGKVAIEALRNVQLDRDAAKYTAGLNKLVEWHRRSLLTPSVGT